MINKSILLFLINSIASAITPPYHLQTQCQGLLPVYDDDGNLMGQRGVCDVDHWNGPESEINSMHPIDIHSMGIDSVHISPHTDPSSSTWFGGLFGQTPVTDHHESGNIKPADLSLFDWLSPHHDIIRNRPEYRKAHITHRHCIHKKKEGLFDFLGKMFGLGSKPSYDHVLNGINDPYMSEHRCLHSKYYAENPFRHGTDQYDPYSMHIGKNIHFLKNQINDPSSIDNVDTLKSNLHANYDRLHRHLDCHCHHELPSSGKYKIHHRPISHHSMRMIAQPDPSRNSQFPLQVHSSMALSPSMDMEDEHVALTRLSGYAAQNAYNSGHFNGGTNALRMQMFQPVNKYPGVSETPDDPEWNKLRVEKIIVIKRIKIPVIRKVSVPVPVPVPYPVMTPSSDTTGSNQSSAQSSVFSSAKSGYMGDNTYLVDSGASPMPMNSLVHAISGAPCECMNTGMMGQSMNSNITNTGMMGQDMMSPIASYGNQMSNSMMNPIASYGNTTPMNGIMMNPSIMGTSTMQYDQSGYNPMGQAYQYQAPYSYSGYNPMMQQPGLQLSPSPMPINNYATTGYSQYGGSMYPRRRNSFLDSLKQSIKYHAADRIASGIVNRVANVANPNLPTYQHQTVAPPLNNLVPPPSPQPGNFAPNPVQPHPINPVQNSQQVPYTQPLQTQTH